MNFSCRTLFHIKTRVCLKYFVNVCRSFTKIELVQCYFSIISHRFMLVTCTIFELQKPQGLFFETVLLEIKACSCAHQSSTQCTQICMLSQTDMSKPVHTTVAGNVDQLFVNNGANNQFI